ncbi:unnamed protein product [Mytilus edulis]|uniref:Uncharacterized protein n=1 Tax=Mytilus edulis TaxID=6550 RepID=A0A8S3RGQ2_MYTED|nr:unnamed protein product [Mytilus edulis]
MERLPSLLTSTIENACRQFRHISFTVHGENDRARVSIVFTNQDSNKTKRKSNSTVNRDKKRMKEYNTDDANSSISENHKDVICSDRSSEISQIPSEEVSTNTLDIMDIDDNPSMASTTSGNIEVIESPNIELSIDTGNELSLPPTCLKGKHVNNVEKCKQRITVDRIEKNKCTVEGDNLVTKCTISKKNNSDIVSTTSPGAQSCDKVKEHNRKVPESGIIRKIVFKKAGARESGYVSVRKCEKKLLLNDDNYTVMLFACLIIADNCLNFNTFDFICVVEWRPALCELLFRL